MNEIYPSGLANQAIAGYAVEAKSAYSNRTIGENIEARIKSHEAEIERLKGVKEQLLSGQSLLNVRIEDLRQAMNY